MIWLIAKKDFLLNLLSVKFLIGFVLCLIIIPFTMVVTVDDYQEQIRSYHTEVQKAENELKKEEVWSFMRPTIIKKPEVLSIFSKGITNNIGNKIRITFSTYPLFPSGQTSGQDNPLLNAFYSIDFSRVIAILISLIALVFAYDTVTRERENGTMKLNFTGKLNRISFMTGKLLGLLITLLPILLFCYILACLIVLLSPGISFTENDWNGIILLFFTSLIYMIVFLLIGIFFSSLVKNSSSSIILCLLGWIWFLFLVPSFSTYLAQSIQDIPLYDNVVKDMAEYDKEFEKEYVNKQRKLDNAAILLGPSSYSNYSSGWDGELRFTTYNLQGLIKNLITQTIWEETIFDFADKKWVLQQDYLNTLLHQYRLQHYIAWLSPSEIFKQITESICRTDVKSYLVYMKSNRDYRETLIRFFKDNEIFKSSTNITTQLLDEINIDEKHIGTPSEALFNTEREKYKQYYFPFKPELLPVYSAPQSDILLTIKDAFTGVTGLIGLLIFFLLAAFALFMRYDIR